VSISFLPCLAVSKRDSYRQGLFSDYGYSFFYADQRTAEGGPMGDNLDGPAHADIFAQLAKGDGEFPWLATFVKDKGYVKF
jgi:hypothetical protein